MADADSEHMRELARQRWQNTALSRAVATVVERRDRLDESMRAALEWAIEARDGGGAA
jgi:hypothetical protein